MPKTIIQKAVFRTTPQKLYALYMDTKAHAAMTHHSARIEKKIGGVFKAFNGALSGKIVHLIPGRMIVQTWRSTNFRKSDPDSILILTFSKVKVGARIDLTHVGVADQDYEGVKKGWPAYYWKPMARYLA